MSSPAVPGISPYWKHVLDAWNRRNDDNVHFMFYEDILLKPEETIKELAAFLGKRLMEDEVKSLKDHLKFENFRNNNSVLAFPINEKEPNKNFIRRGKVGGNPEMTEEISEKFDDWARKNLMNSDLKFPVDI